MLAPEANRVRTIRQTRRISQQVLAKQVGISRQSLSAIEAGRHSPSVGIALRLSSALGCSVENLFAPLEAPAQVRAETSEPVAGRVALGHLAGRWVAHGVAGEVASRSANGLVERTHRARVEVQLLADERRVRDTVLLMGCAPALGVLADRFNAGPGSGPVLWLPRSSTTALDELARDRVHVAGLHLVDPKTSESNLPDIRRRCRSRRVQVYTLAHWEVGLVVASGNPLGLSGLSDLGRNGLRIVGREPGSGARRRLDAELRGIGLDPDALLKRPHLLARGHMEVACAIALGAADVGWAVRHAALAYGLEFLPIADERFDLVLSEENASNPTLARLFDLLTTLPVRRELEALGYDVSRTAEHVAALTGA